MIYENLTNVSKEIIMRKLLALAFMLSGFLFFTSCNEDDGGDGDGDPIVGGIEVLVESNISSDVTWSSDSIYILGGRVTVLDGATLIIEPGTIIKGQTGTGANATALLIARGGKLMAEGTADAPIIFTAVADEIQPGMIESPNMDPDIDGHWGGVIVLGKARISASNEDKTADLSEVQIEGIPTSDPNGLYGGTEDDDNSGVLKYISIRHGGANIGSGNEINGLSLGGVGSGTVVENIEIVSNQDDGIEWFGGTVNVKNAVVWNVNDDAIDTDQSWAGTLDNFVIIAPTGHCFELDGPEGSYEAGHTIKNGTIVATTFDGDDVLRGCEDLINVDKNSIVALENLYFTNIRATGQQVSEDKDTPFSEVPGVTFTAIELDVADEDLGNYINDSVVPTGVGAITTPTVGADVSVFGWTWASNAGAMAGL